MEGLHHSCGTKILAAAVQVQSVLSRTRCTGTMPSPPALPGLNPEKLRLSSSYPARSSAAVPGSGTNTSASTGGIGGIDGARGFRGDPSPSFPAGHIGVSDDEGGCL